jgi:hypothetical protein
MRLWRQDPDELRRRDALHTAKASREELLHPPDDTPRFAGPDDVPGPSARRAPAAAAGSRAAAHLRVDRRWASWRRSSTREPALYRGLTPGALAVLVYLAGRVHDHTGSDAPLTITSTVRDERYQELLRGRNAEATDGYSLHTTGLVVRRPAAATRPGRAARAFQHELQRLQALDLIAWVREPSRHPRHRVTASLGARRRAPRAGCGRRGLTPPREGGTPAAAWSRALLPRPDRIPSGRSRPGTSRRRCP